MQSVYEAAGGRDGLERLAFAWHERVMADPVVSHAFHGGARPDHIERLAAYWGEALGGPPAYTEQYGDETFVVRRHSGNGPHPEMDDRAIVCFDAALDELELDQLVRTVVSDYFAWVTREPLNRYHGSADDVPADLAIPRWSWDGLVEPAGS